MHHKAIKSWTAKIKQICQASALRKFVKQTDITAHIMLYTAERNKKIQNMSTTILWLLGNIILVVGSDQ